MTERALRQRNSRPAFLLVGVGAIAVAGPILVVLVQQFMVLGNRSIPCCEYAALELGTRAFLRGDQWVGLYSREGWHHPGPAPYLWDSLFRVLPGGGFAEHQIAAVSLGLIAIVVLLVVVRRRVDTVSFLTVCFVLGMWIYRFDPGYLREPWNPIVAMSWVLLCATSFAAYASGGSIAWVVVFLATGSMAVQSHVSAGPIVALGGVAIGVLAWHRRDESRFRWTVVVGVIVAGAIWILPFLDLLFGSHNLWHIISSSGEGSIPGDFGLGQLSAGIINVTSLSPSSQALHFGPASPYLPSEPPALLQVAIAVTAVVLGSLAVSRWRDRPFAAATAGIGLLGLLTTGMVLALSTSSFPPYLLFPVIACGPLLWIGGVLNLVATVETRFGNHYSGQLHFLARAALLIPILLLSYFTVTRLPADTLISRYSDADTQSVVDQIARKCEELPPHATVFAGSSVEWFSALPIAVAIDSCLSSAPPTFIGIGFYAGPSFEASPGAAADVFIVDIQEVIGGTVSIARSNKFAVLVATDA